MEELESPAQQECPLTPESQRTIASMVRIAKALQEWRVADPLYEEPDLNTPECQQAIASVSFDFRRGLTGDNLFEFYKSRELTLDQQTAIVRNDERAGLAFAEEFPEKAAAFLDGGEVDRSEITPARMKEILNDLFPEITPVSYEELGPRLQAKIGKKVTIDWMLRVDDTEVKNE